MKKYTHYTVRAYSEGQGQAIRNYLEKTRTCKSRLYPTNQGVYRIKIHPDGMITAGQARDPENTCYNNAIHWREIEHHFGFSEWEEYQRQLKQEEMKEYKHYVINVEAKKEGETVGCWIRDTMNLSNWGADDGKANRSYRIDLTRNIASYSDSKIYESHSENSDFATIEKHFTFSEWQEYLAQLRRKEMKTYDHYVVYARNTAEAKELVAFGKTIRASSQAPVYPEMSYRFHISAEDLGWNGGRPDWYLESTSGYKVEHIFTFAEWKTYQEQLKQKEMTKYNHYVVYLRDQTECETFHTFVTELTGSGHSGIRGSRGHICARIEVSNKNVNWNSGDINVYKEAMYSDYGIEKFFTLSEWQAYQKGITSPTSYKLLKDLPGLPAGAIFEKDADDEYTSGEYFYTEAQIAGAKDWFEAIYEPTIKKHTIIASNGEIVFTLTKGKDITAYDSDACKDVTVSIIDLENLIKTMRGQTMRSSGYDLKFATVDIGCKRGITVLQLQNLLKEYKAL